MKKLKIGALVGILAAMCIGLTACYWPDVLPEDPVETVLTAVFSYYPVTYPVQTGSKILFDGSASEGDIIWAEWDFMEGIDEEDRQQEDTIDEGPWIEVVSDWVNGVEVLEITSDRREVEFEGYDDVLDPDNSDFCYYTVSLTVWDNDGNSAATSRKIKVTNQ